MAGLVLDASVAISWCFPDERNDYAYRVLELLERTQAVVPSLWAVETANALLQGQRRRRITASATAHFLDILGDLPIEVDTQAASRAFAATLPLAQSYGLTAYDATYLELAMREGLPLATLDTKLSDAARAAGVEVLT
jgi:predicted nucleic acid-binding protein